MDDVLRTLTPLLRRNRQQNGNDMLNNHKELIPMITTRARGSLVKKTLFTDNASADNSRFERQRPPQRASAAMALRNWKNQMYADMDATESTLCSSTGKRSRRRRNLGRRSKARTSLYILTLQFLDMLSSEGLVNLNEASNILGAKKRRLYDITCVLYAMGYVCKPMKNFVEYRPSHHSITDDLDFSTSVSFSSEKDKSGFAGLTRSSNYVSLNLVDDVSNEIVRNHSSEDGYITVVLAGVDMKHVNITRSEDNQVEMEVAFQSDDPHNFLFWRETTSINNKSSKWHKVYMFQIELGFRPIQEYMEDMLSGEHTSRPFTELYFHEHLETPFASIPMEESAAEYLDNMEGTQDLLVSLLNDEEKDSNSCEFDTLHCLTTPVKSKA